MYDKLVRSHFLLVQVLLFRFITQLSILISLTSYFLYVECYACKWIDWWIEFYIIILIFWPILWIHVSAWVLFAFILFIIYTLIISSIVMMVFFLHPKYMNYLFSNMFDFTNVLKWDLDQCFASLAFNHSYAPTKSFFILFLSSVNDAITVT